MGGAPPGNTSIQHSPTTRRDTAQFAEYQRIRLLSAGATQGARNGYYAYQKEICEVHKKEKA
jgi:hypothetical protein